jgi:hypothetical protein
MLRPDSPALAGLRNRAAKTASVMVAMAITACNGLDCNSIGAPQGPTLQVDVRGAATGQPAWWGASGYIEDGNFRSDLHPSSTDPNDSLRVLPLFSQSFRKGTYTVRIEKSGFQEWSATGLVVETRGCFLTTHFLEARLERAP